MYTNITNSATDGAAVVVSDIRAEGTDDVQPAVVVACPFPIGGESPLQVGLLRLGSGDVAVFDEQFLEGGGQAFEGGVYGEPGSPVLFNIAPGASSQLLLRISSPGLYTGRIVATVRDGDDESYVVLADGFGTDKAAIPTGPDVLMLQIFEGFSCYTGFYDEAFDCTFDEWRSRVSDLG
jgi:hypothetical protein